MVVDFTKEISRILKCYFFVTKNVQMQEVSLRNINPLKSYSTFDSFCLLFPLDGRTKNKIEVKIVRLSTLKF